jgi:hypothetical protein
MRGPDVHFWEWYSVNEVFYTLLDVLVYIQAIKEGLRILDKSGSVYALDVGNDSWLWQALEVKFVYFLNNFWLILLSLFEEALEPLLQLWEVGLGLRLELKIYLLFGGSGLEILDSFDVLVIFA